MASPSKRVKQDSSLAGYISDLSPKKKTYYFNLQHGPNEHTRVQGFGSETTYQKLKLAEGSSSPIKITVQERANYRYPVFNDSSKLEPADPITEVNM